MEILIVISIIIIVLVGIGVGAIVITSGKLLEQKAISPTDYANLLSILASQVQSELDTYDKDIFTDKGSITNNNFDNYYKDLTTRIINNISDDLINSLTQYYTIDAIYRMIGRSVRDYLLTKINGTL